MTERVKWFIIFVIKDILFERVLLMKDIIRRAELIRVYRKALRLGILSKNIDVIDIYKRIFGVSRTRKDAYELMALYDTVRYFENCEKRDILRAVAFVYCPGKARYYSRNEISMRVLRFADENHYDERTIWRMLSRAADKFFEFMGSYRK